MIKIVLQYMKSEGNDMENHLLMPPGSQNEYLHEFVTIYLHFFEKNKSEYIFDLKHTPNASISIKNDIIMHFLS